MTTTQKNLIRDTKIILADLEAIGTKASAKAARDLIARTYKMLGNVDLADLVAELAA